MIVHGYWAGIALYGSEGRYGGVWLLLCGTGRKSIGVEGHEGLTSTGCTYYRIWLPGRL